MNYIWQTKGLKASASTPRDKRGILLAALFCVSLALTSCGGGDSSSTTSPPPISNDPLNPPAAAGTAPASYTISGSIRIAETASIDADINDANAPYASNDTFAKAQTIPNPTLLIGHLTLKGQGPVGPNRDQGDLIDFYKVRLQAGQLIELEFTSKPADIDIDLYVYNAAKQVVGRSTGENAYECIRITSTGDYYISAEIYEPSSVNDSVYQMRIAAPNASNASCGQVTSAGLVNVVAGEIIAEPLASTSDGLSLKAAPGIQPIGIAGTGQVGTPSLFSVPISPSILKSDLSKVPKSLSARAASTKQAPALSSAGYASQNDPDATPESKAILETIAYAKAMKRSGGWAYAFPNFTLQSSQLAGTLPSNDREYPRQRWHYEMIGLPAALSTLNALSPQPTRRPIVAVVDTGIVSDHPDLRGNIIGGYDFVKSVAVAGDGNGIDNNPDDSSRASTNPSFHGTHVAGTVAAVGFNNVGGLGIAPMAQIMPLRALGEGGSGSFYDIIQAMYFAAGLPNDSLTVPPVRADVINLSLGGDGACTSEIVNIFDRIRAQGTLIVAASGNESQSTSLTPVGNPANCSGVIAVGAVDAQRTRAFYSNGGAELTLVAPGGDVSKSTTGTGNPDGVFSTIGTFQGGIRTASYAPLMGTSMATPHVAGVIALMRWVNPNITGAQIAALISAGSITDDLGAFGRDNLYGMGLINAKKAVDAAIASKGTASAPVATPNDGRVEPSPSNLSFGTTRTELELILRKVGQSTETVTAISTSNPGLSVVAKLGAVDSTKLGNYSVLVDRSLIGVAAGGSSFLQVTVTTSTGRSIIIPVDVSKAASAASTGSYGPIYVLVTDADDPDGQTVAEATVVTPVNGEYRYSILIKDSILRPGIAPGRVTVFAGGDTDNDDYICSRGEACGGYPVLGNNPTIIEPRAATVSGINFDVAPFGGINPAAAAFGTANTSARSAHFKRRTSSALSSMGSTK